jgi:cytochrome oxidase Cu insertion factor (SCO1/SenC/PrrC family)
MHDQKARKVGRNRLSKKRGVLMPQRYVILTFLFVLLSISAVRGQLGPKDGANLAPTDLERVKVGQPAPDFALEDVNGKSVSLSDFRGKKSVVLVFYRGYW